jgi:succinyl-diaminopimelate desuccinylase
MAAELSRAAPLDPVALAAELIRYPSVTPKDEGALPHLAAILEQFGFTCHLQEFTEPGTAPVLNLYASIGKGGRNFCFAGHMDVVPPGDLGAWTLGPFAGTVTADILHGRGAADMKGAIACFAAAAARFLAARGRDFGGRISLLITGDEEGARVNGTRKLLAWAVERGETLSTCIIGEPTNTRAMGDLAKIGRRGNIYAYITVEGVQGHTAYPHLADNAAQRLVRMLHALLASPLDQGTAHFQPSDLQIATVDVGNPTDNVIPGTARATINIRFNDRWTTATIKEWIKSRLDAVGGRYSLRFRESCDAFLVPPGELAELLSRATEKVTGRRPELSTTGGASDGCFIHHYCEVAEFGLVGLTQHKVDEQVPLADIGALTDIYATLLELYFPAR